MLRSFSIYVQFVNLNIVMDIKVTIIIFNTQAESQKCVNVRAKRFLIEKCDRDSVSTRYDQNKERSFLDYYRYCVILTS